MAATWLLQVLYTSLLSSSSLQGGSSDDIQYVLANTTHGTVRGKVDFTPQVPVAKFFGIPFAKPPIDSLRFKAPVNPDKWAGLRDALQFGNSCLQDKNGFHLKNEEGTTDYNEDCLYLNIYSPVNISKTLMPVMVWIHGGGYTVGAGAEYDARHLAVNGVVLVTINYRLDAFGFLSTEDDVMPGNYGMMDQVAALRWVKDNIAEFGGDPNQVTIFGESAGGSSVSQLILSPLTKGLFQKAIQESGSALCPWATQHPANKVSPRMMARLMGVAFDCMDLDNTTSLLQCLQQIDSEKLINTSLDLYKTVNAGLLYSPRVEKTFGFLPDLPINLLSRGEFNHVDSISGFNGHESFSFFTFTNFSIDIIYKSPEKARLLLEDFTTFFTKLKQNQAIKLMESTFSINTMNNTDIVKQTVSALDSMYYHGPVVVEINRILAAASEKKHYLYEFSYRPSFTDGPQWVTTPHGGEIPFIFNTKYYPDYANYGWGPLNGTDMQVSKQMTEMWINFAKTGDPTITTPKGGVKWEPYTLTTQKYLKVNQQSAVESWSRQKVNDFYQIMLQFMDTGIPGSFSGGSIVG